MAIRNANQAKLNYQVRERVHDRKISGILNEHAFKRPVLTPDEELEVAQLVSRERLALQIRTNTDVSWCTITTSDTGEDTDTRNRMIKRLKDMWYDGFSSMYPEGTEWRIKSEYW